MRNVTDTVAKAIYEERGRSGIVWLKWEDQTEAVRDIWRGCAIAAIDALNKEGVQNGQH